MAGGNISCFLCKAHVFYQKDDKLPLTDHLRSQCFHIIIQDFRQWNGKVDFNIDEVRMDVPLHNSESD